MSGPHAGAGFWPWASGLVHGFGFSFALRETLQFAGSHLVTSLLAFNVGVELGQLFVLVLLVPALTGLFRFVVAERLGTIILSALAAHHAWHWLLERTEFLARFDMDWSATRIAPWWQVGIALLGIAAIAALLHARRNKNGAPINKPIER